VGEALVRLQLEPARLRIVGAIGLLQQRGELRPARARDVDEPPGMELAVIGRPQRAAKNLVELRGARAGLAQIARAARTAGPQQRRDRGASRRR
jgi:hypothetical protein